MRLVVRCSHNIHYERHEYIVKIVKCVNGTPVRAVCSHAGRARYLFAHARVRVCLRIKTARANREHKGERRLHHDSRCSALIFSGAPHPTAHKTKRCDVALQRVCYYIFPQ